jgi:hypothetical protein
MTTDDDRLTVLTPKLRQLFALWRAKSRGRAFPARGDFDPVELRFVLAHLFLVDHLPDGNEFRFRVYGTHLAEKERIDLTGKLVSDHPDGDHAIRVNRVLRWVQRRGRPWLAQEYFVVDQRPWRDAALCLPLGRDGGTVDMVLGGIEFIP